MHLLIVRPQMEGLFNMGCSLCSDNTRRRCFSTVDFNSKGTFFPPCEFSLHVNSCLMSSLDPKYLEFNAKNRIVDANPPFQRLIGNTSSEFFEKPIGDVWLAGLTRLYRAVGVKKAWK